MFANSKKSFTLVELLVVIAVIGLLSSIVFVSVSSVKKKARDIRVITNLTTICKALEAYYIENSHYPSVGCSYSGQPYGEQLGVYRDAHLDNDEIFNILQPFLSPGIVSFVPNDPDAKDPSTDWSYFYDNYYDNVVPENTPETTECTNQAFQLLGYIEVSDVPFEWEPTWGTYLGEGWWRACKGFPK